jgi:short-subunit dehydrogenase
VLAARSEARPAEIADMINGEGGEAIHVVADVGREGDVRRIADAAIDRFGRIDTWVNDAGGTDALRIEVADLDKAPVAITLIQPTAVNTPYPQHARNYMDKEPKLPTPLIDPQRVANAILKAATEPARDIKVGMMSKVNTTMAKIAPALGEKIAARQARRQQYDQPPSRDPQGALWKASGGGDIYGHRPAP